MNIAFYFDFQINPERGGTERVTDILAHYFISKGHSVCYIAQVAVDGEYDIQTYFLPEVTDYKTSLNTEFIVNLIQKEKIDIIINQAGNLDAVYLFSHANLRCNIKIITCIHFSIDFGTAYFYRSLSLPKITYKQLFLSIKNSIKLLLAPYFKYSKIKGIKNRNRFIQSDSDKVVLLASNYVREIKEFSKLSSIANVIFINNPNSYKLKACKIGKQKEIIFVGRLHEQKRPEYLLKIWKSLHLQFPDWKLTFVGDGPLRHKMEAIVKNNKLTHVNFEGFTDSFPYYERASIICLTSLYEGFPMVILEAKLHGVIPIVYNTFGSSFDLIEDGKTGFIIPPFHINSYVKSLAMLMKDEGMRLTMSRNSRDDSNRFNIENIGNQWDMLLKDVIKINN